ncbi:17-beta-hydroxysteroid dehydrogenase 14-like [Mytilus trossulus]|uniref:17-beta-hydroxysteroid dehydrogenase 14-like n=1 Tax=Mytilus trossulus TaxID=6551 RepID=UPI003005EA5B
MADGLRYKDKVTIITGGSSGIGKGCLQMFVRNGAKVVFCSNDENQGQAVEKELCESEKGEAKFVYADMCSEEDVKNLVEQTVKRYGKIDCLINNAGTHPAFQPIDEFTSEDFRKLFDLNVLGYFRASKYALPYLRETEGNIINMASMSGQHSEKFAVTYAATKGAVSAMTRALAIDEAMYNVRVNAVSPGPTRTPLLVEVANQSPDTKARLQELANHSVLGRMGEPEEVALTCLYLAADATFCTGEEIQVCGGSGLNYANKNMRVALSS